MSSKRKNRREEKEKGGRKERIEGGEEESVEEKEAMQSVQTKQTPSI